MAARSYIRVLTDLVDRKLAAGYTDSQIVAYVQALLKGAIQPNPGRFVNQQVLKGWLGRHARYIPYLVGQQDLLQAGQVFYLDGWDELQEGDETVAERMRRYRDRKKGGQTGLPFDLSSRDNSYDLNSSSSRNGALRSGANAIANADALKEQRGKGDAGENPDDERVFDTWYRSLPPGSRMTFTAKRRAKVRARLQRYPVEQLEAAVCAGWQNDPWSERPLQNDLTILLRDDTQAEKFINLALNGAPKPSPFKPDGPVARLQARRAALHQAFAEAPA